MPAVSKESFMNKSGPQSDEEISDDITGMDDTADAEIEADGLDDVEDMDDHEQEAPKVEEAVEGIKNSTYLCDEEKKYLTIFIESDSKTAKDMAFAKLWEFCEKPVISALHSFERSKSYDYADVDDLMQDTMIRLYNALSRFHDNPNGYGLFRGDSQLSTYVTRVAINLAKNKRTYNQRRSYNKHFEFSESHDDNDDDSLSYIIQSEIQQTNPEMFETESPEVAAYNMALCDHYEQAFEALLLDSIEKADCYALREGTEGYTTRQINPETGKRFVIPAMQDYDDSYDNIEIIIGISGGTVRSRIYRAREFIENYTRQAEPETYPAKLLHQYGLNSPVFEGVARKELKDVFDKADPECFAEAFELLKADKPKTADAFALKYFPKYTSSEGHTKPVSMFYTNHEIAAVLSISTNSTTIYVRQAKESLQEIMGDVASDNEARSKLDPRKNAYDQFILRHGLYRHSFSRLRDENQALFGKDREGLNLFIDAFDELRRGDRQFADAFALNDFPEYVAENGFVKTAGLSLSQKDIAKALGVKRSVVKSRCADARKKLKKIINCLELEENERALDAQTLEALGLNDDQDAIIIKYGLYRQEFKDFIDRFPKLSLRTREDMRAFADAFDSLQVKHRDKADCFGLAYLPKYITLGGDEKEPGRTYSQPQIAEMLDASTGAVEYAAKYIREAIETFLEQVRNDRKKLEVLCEQGHPYLDHIERYGLYRSSFLDAHPEFATASEEEQGAYIRAFERLKEEQREFADSYALFHFSEYIAANGYQKRYSDRFSHEDAAKALGVPRSISESRSHDALKKMNKFIQQEEAYKKQSRRDEMKGNALNADDPHEGRVLKYGLYRESFETFKADYPELFEKDGQDMTLFVESFERLRAYNTGQADCFAFMYFPEYTASTGGQKVAAAQPYTQDRVAKEMDISVKLARSRMYEGLEKMRKYVAEAKVDRAALTEVKAHAECCYDFNVKSGIYRQEFNKVAINDVNDNMAFSEAFQKLETQDQKAAQVFALACFPEYRLDAQREKEFGEQIAYSDIAKQFNMKNVAEVNRTVARAKTFIEETMQARIA